MWLQIGYIADNWRRKLASNSFGSCFLEKSFARFVKNLQTIYTSGYSKSLEVLTESYLIPLNKNPGVLPKRIGDVLRQVAGKIVIYIAKKDVQEIAGAL